MNTLLIVVLAFVALIVLLGVIAPSNYDVNRKINVNKPVPEVFNYLRLLKNQDNWSPWAEKDPNMEKSFSGTDGEVGCISSWSGNKDVGSGEQEIKNIVENQIIESELRFLKPFKSTSDAYLKVSEAGEGTEVIWGFSGKNVFPISIMMLFMNMEKTIGKDFEDGLKRLKENLES